MKINCEIKLKNYKLCDGCFCRNPEGNCDMYGKSLDWGAVRALVKGGELEYGNLRLKKCIKENGL